MKLCWIINRALLLSLILMNLEIPVAESIEFPSGLRVGETGCAGGATDKWEIGFLPEFWFVLTTLKVGDGHEEVEGPMFGMSGYATKNYANGSFTLYGGFRHGKFDIDGEYTSSGIRNQYTGDIKQFQSEVKARWLFDKKPCRFLCCYVIGGMAYTKLSKEHLSLSPGWTYNISGSEQLKKDEIYFTPFVGVGFISEISEKWVHRFELTLNVSHGSEKTKNARPGVGNSREDMAFGYGYLYTLLYRLNDSFHIQGGIRGEGLNQYFESDDAPQFAYHGMFVRVSFNF